MTIQSYHRTLAAVKVSIALCLPALGLLLFGESIFGSSDLLTRVSVILMFASSLLMVSLLVVASRAKQKLLQHISEELQLTLAPTFVRAADAEAGRLGEIPREELPLLKRAYGWRNVLYHDESLPRVFELQIGDDESPQFQTVYCFRNERTLPRFSLTPKSKSDRFWESVLGDIDAVEFESDQLFSETFTLHTSNREDVERYFNSTRRANLCRRVDSDFLWSVQSTSSHVILFRQCIIADPTNISDELRECQALHQQVFDTA